MCVTPLTLVVDKRSSSDEVTRVVPCGRCRECLRKRTSGWTFRLIQEANDSSSAVFYTLTYADEKLPCNQWGEPELRKSHFQDFMKKLRHETPNRLRYFACGEYGSKTDRPHYHAIIFNLPGDLTRCPDRVEQIWGHGHIHQGEGNAATFGYTAKYLMKRTHEEWKPQDRQPEFQLQSKGLGAGFLTPAMLKYLRENEQTYVHLNGFKVGLPRYYMEKIFTPEQRKRLAKRAELEREEFDRKSFDNDVSKKDIWIRDQIRQAEKINRLQEQRNL